MSRLIFYVFIIFVRQNYFTKYVAFTFANTLITPPSIVVDAPAASASIVIALFDINILYCGRDELLVVQLMSTVLMPASVVGTVLATAFARV